MIQYPPTSPDYDYLDALDVELRRALEADGEKLRQLTGEDHGPWSAVPVPCPVCDGAGEWDEGPLPASSGATEPVYRQVICGECDGSGTILAEASEATRTLDDLLDD